MFKRIAILLIALTLLSAVPANALDFEQKQWYGQGIIALPMGDFGEIANTGFGFGAGLHVPHNLDWSFRGEISYIYFTTEDMPGFDISASQIPITALAQYSLKDSKFYFLGGLTLAFSKASVDYEIEGFEGGSDSSTSTDFGLNLGAGYVVSPKVDLGARFNLISDANSFSLHVAYKF